MRVTDQPRLFDQDRMTQVRNDRKAVRSAGSVLALYDWSGHDCRRCGHPVTKRHRPGRTGLCDAKNCTCLLADLECRCGHTGFDHEAWGAERVTGCGRCECARFAPTPTNR